MPPALGRRNVSGRSTAYLSPTEQEETAEESVARCVIPTGKAGLGVFQERGVSRMHTVTDLPQTSPREPALDIGARASSSTQAGGAPSPRCSMGNHPAPAAHAAVPSAGLLAVLVPSSAHLSVPISFFPSKTGREADGKPAPERLHAPSLGDGPRIRKTPLPKASGPHSGADALVPTDANPRGHGLQTLNPK